MKPVQVFWVKVSNVFHNFASNSWTIDIAKNNGCETEQFYSKRLRDLFIEKLLRKKAWEAWFFITAFEKSPVDILSMVNTISLVIFCLNDCCAKLVYHIIRIKRHQGVCGIQYVTYIILIIVNDFSARFRFFELRTY